MRLFIGPAILAFSFGLNPEQEPSHHSSQQEAEARTVAHRPGESVRVRVPLSQAANHRVTIVSFPEPVARAIVPWGEEDISIETDGREVVLKLLKPVEGDLAFRGAKSGTLFRLRVAPAKGDGDSDGLVRIVLPDEKPAARAIPAPAKSGAIELLRSMRLGDVPPDATVSAAPEASPIHETSDVAIRPRLLYSTEAHHGLVLELVNRRKDGSFRVDLSRFAAERLVLVGARELVVAPEGSTRLYFVFWR